MRDVIEGIEEFIPQVKLAKKMGVSPRTIRKWKTGARKPSAEKRTKLNRIRGGFRAHGTKKPIHRRRRITRDLRGRKILAQRSAAEGVLFGVANKPDVNDFLEQLYLIFNGIFRGPAWSRFKSIHNWMLSGNLFSGIQIGCEFDMQFAHKEMDELISRAKQTMFTISLPQDYSDAPEALEVLIENLISNFRKWLTQSPMDNLVVNFRKWFIISYRYRDL